MSSHLKNQENNRINNENEIFCWSCGKPIKKEAVICVNCGVKVKTSLDKTKSKLVSVLLSIFLGYWSWLYTHKVDLWKFVIGICFHTIYITLALTHYEITIFIGPIGILICWLWPLLQNITRPNSFFENFISDT